MHRSGRRSLALNTESMVVFEIADALSAHLVRSSGEVWRVELHDLTDSAPQRQLVGCSDSVHAAGQEYVKLITHEVSRRWEPHAYEGFLACYLGCFDKPGIKEPDSDEALRFHFGWTKAGVLFAALERLLYDYRIVGNEDQDTS